MRWLALRAAATATACAPTAPTASSLTPTTAGQRAAAVLLRGLGVKHGNGVGDVPGATRRGADEHAVLVLAVAEAEAVPAHRLAGNRAAAATKHGGLVDGFIILEPEVREHHAVERLGSACHLRLVGDLVALAADRPELLHLVGYAEEVGLTVGVAQVLGAAVQLLGGLGGDVCRVRQEREVLDDLRVLIVAGLGGEVGEEGGKVAGRGVGDADVGHLDVSPLVRERHLRDAARWIGRRLLLDDLQHVAREGVAAALVALQVDARERLPGLWVAGAVDGRGAGGDDGVKDGGAGVESIGTVLGDEVVDTRLHERVQHVSAEGGDYGRVSAEEGRLRLALLGGVAHVVALEVNVLRVSHELVGGGRDDTAWALAGEVLLVGAEVITLPHQAREEGGQKALGELFSAPARPRRAQVVAPGVVGSGGRSHLRHARGVRVLLTS